MTHGEAGVALMTGIFHQVFLLYALQKFATDTDIFQVILPHSPTDAYFDDRLGDTLDARYTAGLGDLELILTPSHVGRIRHQCGQCSLRDDYGLGLWGLRRSGIPG